MPLYCSALSLARSAQVERDNELCFFVRTADVHRFIRRYHAKNYLEFVYRIAIKISDRIRTERNTPKVISEYITNTPTSRETPRDGRAAREGGTRPPN
ncbi:hypothetical protein EVAR_45735_1 [Eumeta japonica]|uniref:Uncharacterized protein n=1 Tax=Eumeta variegata TaxID=151549 RepID=A0A4C1WXM0_EUMVA|nr:hypothetical protein EVAR_45735_1 [Eumeta japonica]